MRALLQLARRGLFLPWCGVALAIATGVLACDLRFWTEPQDDHWIGLLALWSVAGFLAGLVVFGFHEWTGTRAYLLHRGVERSTLFRAGWIVALAMTLGWIAVGLGAPFVGFLVFSDLGPFLSGDALWRHVAVASLGVSGCAAGAFCASLRARAVVQALAGVVLLVALFAGAYALLERRDERWAGSLSLYLGAQLVSALCLAYASRSGFLDARDADRPRSLAQRWAPASALFLGGLVVAVSLIPRAQDEVAQELLQAYPWVAQTPAGGVGLCDDDEGYDGYVWLDEEHAPLPLPATDRPQLLWMRWSSGFPRDREADPAIESRRVNARGVLHPGWLLDPVAHRSDVRLFLMRPGGRLIAEYWSNRRAPEARLRRVERRTLVKPSGEPFPMEATTVGVVDRLGFQREYALLADPLEGLVYSLDLLDRDAQLVPRPLPDGERYTGWFRDGSYEPEGRYQGAPEEFVVEGSRSLWRWDPSRNGWRKELRDEFLPADWVDPGPEPYTFATTRFDSPVEFRLEVVDRATGELAFAHEFRPRRFEERAISVSLALLASMRSPLGLLAGFVTELPPVSERETYRTASFFDPGVRAGHGLGVLLFAWALALGLSVRIARADRRRGASTARSAFYIALVLLGGWPLALIHAGLEPAAAWRRKATSARNHRVAERPGALIESAP